jgi:Protein of unknown function (DUF1697)
MSCAIAAPARLSQWQNDGMPTHVALLRGINVGGRNWATVNKLLALCDG